MNRRKTREHLDEEKRLRPQGITVPSLFFDGTVEHCRSDDEAGMGEYALTLEKGCPRRAKHPDCRSMFREVGSRNGRR